MTDISHILPFEAFVLIMLAIMGAIACWPDNKR